MNRGQQAVTIERITNLPELAFDSDPSLPDSTKMLYGDLRDGDKRIAIGQPDEEAA